MASSPSEVGSSTSQFIVEKVLKKRVLDDGTEQYFLKWLHYDSRENTWEPRGNIAPALIEEFEREQRRKEAERRAANVKSGRMTIDGDGHNREGRKAQLQSKSERKKLSTCERIEKRAKKSIKEVSI